MNERKLWRFFFEGGDRPKGAQTRLAERGGFEPPVGFKPTHAFQACALNHSAISPPAVDYCAEAYHKSQLLSGLVAAVHTTRGASFGDDYFPQRGQARFQLFPDPKGNVLAGRIFQAGNLV